MAEPCFKIRVDLDIQLETQAAGSAVIVKDPITRRFYRFSAVQATALQFLNGNHDLSSIAQMVSKQHSINATQEQIGDFVGKLRTLLLLDAPECWSRLEKAGRTRRWALQNALSIKLLTFNPDRLLGMLLNKVRFCFSPAFGTAALIAMFAAGAITILNWESLSGSVRSLATVNSLPLLFFVAFSVLSIHEFAHGLTLKHYGGKAEEMGLIILYFLPAFYCNVDDAWMLEKRKRIWITLAGSYAQLCIWAASTICWRMLAVETFLSRLCLITIAFSGIQTLINFIPLIRLDGYYLLSDYLEIPNLRGKSFSFLKRILTRGLLAREEGKPKKLSTREIRIFASYGLGAFLFTAGLLWIVLKSLAGWIVEEFQTWGLVALGIAIAMAIPVAKSNDDKASTESRLAPRPFWRKKVLYRLGVLGLLLLAGVIPWELKIAGDFTIIPSKKNSVIPEVSGTLKAIYVEEGSRVQTGQLLAEIQNFDLSNSFEETKGELASKKADLDLLLAGSRPEEIEKAKRQIETKRAELNTILRVEQQRKVLHEAVARKEAELRNAQENYDRSRRLLRDGLIARNEVQRDQTLFEIRQKELAEARGQLRVLDEKTEREYQVKKTELAQAESELNILLAGSRKELIRATEADVQKLKEKLNILAQQIEQLKIRSPMQGIVATAYLRNRIGEYLDKGYVFCEIVSEGTVIIDMPVPEKEIADVRVGFPITLKVRGYSNRTFQAHVRDISPVAVEKGSEHKVVVHGEIGDSEGILKAGMTGVGKILCGKRLVAELVTRRLIRWLRTEFWEYLP